MKKILFLLIEILLMLTLFTGCVSTNVTRSEAKNYVENTLGIDNYKVSWFKKNSDDNLGQVWQVYDVDEDLYFDVYGTIRFSADYIIDAYRAIADNYDKKLIEKYTADIPENITYYPKDTNYRFESYLGGFQINYSNLEQLEEGVDYYWNIVERLKHDNVDLPFIFKYVDPNANSEDKLLHDLPTAQYIEFEGHVGPTEYNKDEFYKSKDDILNDVKESYFLYGLVYVDDNVLADMTNTDVKDIKLKYSNKTVYVVDDIDAAINGLSEGLRLSKKCIPLCIERVPCRITYGGLYNLLLEEGYDLSGDHNHYSVSTEEGDVYEFSTDFVDTDRLAQRSYYLKNGERVYTNLDEDIVVDHKIILDCFDLYIDFGDYFQYLNKEARERKEE